jgi:hypothetical protein
VKLSSVPAPVWQLAASVAGGLIVLYLVRHYGAKVGQAVNPLNHDNVFASSVNAAGAAVSGDDSFTLGAGLFNLFHEDEFEKSEREHRERLAKRG